MRVIESQEELIVLRTQPVLQVCTEERNTALPDIALVLANVLDKKKRPNWQHWSIPNRLVEEKLRFQGHFMSFAKVKFPINFLFELLSRLLSITKV